MKELRQVYSAPTEESALITLDKLEETWGKNILYQSELGDRIGLMLQRFLNTLMK